MLPQLSPFWTDLYPQVPNRLQEVYSSPNPLLSSPHYLPELGLWHRAQGQLPHVYHNNQGRLMPVLARIPQGILFLIFSMKRHSIAFLLPDPNPNPFLISPDSSSSGTILNTRSINFLKSNFNSRN